MQTVVETKQISKIYKTYQKKPGLMASLKSLFHREWQEKVAIDSLDLAIFEGETVGLLGANGAGKTTLVKLLSGIMVPSSGTATVNGFTPWERKNGFKKQIALIMGQKAQLWWDLPAADCFLLLKEIYRIPSEQYQERLNQLVDTLKVSQLLNVQIRRLSLGERMKMEIIACLLHRPKVIFLDEPTIGLDISTQKAIHQFLKEYRQKYKPVIILTSHYMSDTEALCDRIIVVKGGKKTYDGSLQDLQSKFHRKKILHFECTESEVSKLVELSEKYEFDFETRDNIMIEIKVPKIDLQKFSMECLKLVEPNDFSLRDPEISDTIEQIMAGNKLEQ